MQNVAFIINPFSSHGNYQPFLQEIEKQLPNALIYISQSIQGTQDFIEDHKEEIEIFVAVGGDGTISTVAQMLVGTDRILAIFPMGSGNGFANETHFNKNIQQLILKLKSKKSQTIDTFTVNGRFSINVAGVGFDGAVIEAFEKTSRGFKNYIKVSLQTFFKYKPIHIRFLDEKYQKHNGKYLMLNVANTRQFGNNAYIAPQASHSDGLLELALVKKFPFSHAPSFAYRMFTKKLIPNRYLDYISTDEIQFEVDSQLWHLDGEFNKITSPVHVKIQPRSLTILVS
ncbi:MAG: diacylglycerol kinase [Bacteroidetes bacterium]|nr:diacylglycerol kinase [Bacteroidota bacterium]